MRDLQCETYNLQDGTLHYQDYDYQRNRIELELNFPFSCGCEGVFEGEKLPLEVIAKAAQTMMQKILGATANDLKLPVTDKRVASEARARILRIGVQKADIQVDPET